MDEATSLKSRDGMDVECQGEICFGQEEGNLPVVAGGKRGGVQMQRILLGTVSRRDPCLMIPVSSAEWDASPPAGSEEPGGDVGREESRGETCAGKNEGEGLQENNKIPGQLKVRDDELL